MVRSFVLFIFGAAFLAQASSQTGMLDPAFNTVPFDKWIKTNDPGPFHLSMSVPHAELSFHQRLITQITVTLDGRDLENRRKDGHLLVLIQITSSDGARFQDHYSMDLDKVDENIKAANIEYSFRAFVLPGDYRADVAFLDTHTNEHGTAQAQFRVAVPRHELLPDAWRDLPPVEFIGDEESPDSWYLPSVHGQLQWAASVHAKARINVVLNVAPAALVNGSRSTSSRDLSALLPTLKAISQTGSSSLSERVELLDLARRRTVFEQTIGPELDWTRLKASLTEANTASIDVHTLSDPHHDAQFFVSQVRSLLRGSESPCVLVVLTKPVEFASGEDLEPISLEALPACHVIYIRYRPLVRAAPFPQRGMGGRGRGTWMGGPMSRNHQNFEIDQLETTLKPLNPKVFDVETPEQVTKAIAEIEKAL